MGYGAKERVKERLETEKFIGDVSIADLNRLAAQEDFSDPTGGTFDTAVIDPAAGPRIISSRAKESILLEQDRLSTKYKASQEKVADFVNSRFSEGAKIPAGLGESATDVGINLSTALANDETAGEIGQLAKEFKRKMEYEAFKDASSGYNLGRAEIKQVNPAFLTLYDEFSIQRDSVDFVDNESFMRAIKNNTVVPGTYTVFHKGKVETMDLDQERINQLRGTD